MARSQVYWPPDQVFVSPDDRDELSARCREAYRETVRSHRIEADLTPLLSSLYLPLAAWIDRLVRATDPPPVVGLCGAQGSGKSTVVDLLKTVLEYGFDRRVARFSIDDVYLTHAERRRLAAEVHPLFATRGVPGTHDVRLGVELIASLRRLGHGARLPVPSFDKARDTRRPESEWPRFEGPADVILFEGWCVGAVPQPAAQLVQPINVLERDEDPQAVWRTAVNRALEQTYGELFGLIDTLLLLQVEGMHRVFEWRRLQERKLASKAAEENLDSDGLRIMSDDEVDRFVMHYERLTRHILSEMPGRADVVLPVDETHNPAAVRINRPIR